MTVEVSNGVMESIPSHPNNQTSKKSRDAERRRRRRKQKKNKSAGGEDRGSGNVSEDRDGVIDYDSAKENSDLQKIRIQDHNDNSRDFEKLLQWMTSASGFWDFQIIRKL